VLLRVRWELARRDPLEFARWFVFTLDQKDRHQAIKPFPAERPHVQHFLNTWHAIYKRELLVRNPQNGEMIEATGLLGHKCRQMLFTWCGCVVCVWDALFHPGRLIFLQSKREDDAIGNEYAGTGLLGRCKFIIRHIPGLRELMPELDMDKQFTTSRIEFASQNSMLWAIPEGGDIIRSHTPSGLFTDEAAFQPEFGNAYAASIAGLRGGGWLLAVSTANPGKFQDLCDDRVT